MPKAPLLALARAPGPQNSPSALFRAEKARLSARLGWVEGLGSLVVGPGFAQRGAQRDGKCQTSP